MDLRIPLYLQLKNTLLNRIDNGELLPGERLESERDLAEKYGVNRQTVRSALNVLIEDGVLIKVPYKGTFVAKQIVKPAWGNYDAVDDHRGFSSFLKAQGFTIDSKVIVAEKIEPTTSIRAHLKLEEGEDVYCLERVRYYNDEPFSVEIAYMPYKYVDGIEDYDFSKVSLYDFMATKDHDPCDFHRSLIVQFPDDRISKLLGNLVEPVFRFQYIGFDKKKNVVEYTHSYIRSDKSTYRIRI